MSEDTFQLKYTETNEVIVALNTKFSGTGKNIVEAIKCYHPSGFPSLTQIENWVEALKSRKEIINPQTPKEELRRYYDSFDSSDDDVRKYTDFPETAIEKTIAIIAKVYPDVATWLDGDA